MTLTNFTTDALEGLCTQEQLELLNSIDTLRSQGISHYVSLPQIIVCGDQSSGKSSVLEAISGVSFPVKSSLCTRFPTELVLRKNSQVGVRVSIVPHQSRSEAEQHSLSSFCEQLDGFDGLANLIENAKAAMGISTHGKAFSNDLLRVEVSGPDRPHLTIVDLPGLIHSETRQQSAADVQLVQDVVQSYMSEPRSVILAVVSAKNDFANQIVLRLAREADPSGNRTLGVISKPDMLVPGSESEASFVSLAKNQDVEFRLGWHVLMNMDSEKGQWSLSDRDIHEWKFFSQGIWGDLPRSLVGVDSLRPRLSSLLLGQIAGELPSLINEINTKINTCRLQLQKLGDPRATLDEQRSYLLHISQAFQSLVKAAVDGTYNEPFFGDAKTDDGYQKRIRAVIQNLNQKFTDDISHHGHFRHVLESEEPRSISKGQVLLKREEFVQQIGMLLKKTRGRELPGTFNPLIVKDLFQEQCAPWEDITRVHITASWKAVKEFIHRAVSHVADEATSKALFAKFILPALENVRHTLEKGSEELLVPHQRGHPITYNHYFTETLQKTRAGRQKETLGKALESYFGVDTLSTCEVYMDNINLRGLLDSLVQTTIPDMTRFASEEALDCMLAYYKVALKRFVDDIATEVIEVKLLGAITTLFTPITAFHMPEELIRQIAGESEESQSRREQLNKMLWILGKGSDTCKRFVGIRGLESKNEVQAGLRNNRATLPSNSCNSVDRINSEPGHGQSRSCSPDILEQTLKDEYSLEHPTEPEQLEAPPPRKNGKKKYKRSAHTLLSPVDSLVEPSLE
ncbi:uncharacterized protein N7479_001720 [Penicillium vulpinum]|uniref:GED domain-containing protein n=1 Tax=Penicillium vulpinum TaxID=29845 RepID=A0A1V6R7V4_9EURO|nr:uncharacterized protein N7479_001720 [Penicillium vulpinum]KAJ5971802.1 hypothetical protein N7479_001720 [Penicillium vulpinum]OQD97559.1 hypothetical protein PENVUL_c083G06147 [Penicillium vulpinum]